MNAIPKPAVLPDYYQAVRQQTLNLCAPLEVEDYQIQPMADASPPKWHLAHVTWFFETFLLKPNVADYAVFDEAFHTLFNSYYNGVGQPFTRANRGHLSRPTLDQIFAYREYVDDHMIRLLSSQITDEAKFRVTLGLHHEQQHQELILTDMKYNFGNNPLLPAYVSKDRIAKPSADLVFHQFDGGLCLIGADSGEHFIFDNETPRHQVWLEPFQLASRAVTNGEYLEFMQDGGYEKAELWLSDGWSHVQTVCWQAPLYWYRHDGDWWHYTLSGPRMVDPAEPVCHISGYEADAYARWCGCRLPTEAEWEVAAADQKIEGNFVEQANFHPRSQSSDGMCGLFGDVWEWTQTSYAAYPGFKPFPGQIGEYNGKFMANQMVLRGGSCATPQSHVRASYRNFFYPPDRWQFSGIRLAKD